MHRFFLEKNFSKELQIVGADARHIIRVLRMQTGDVVQLVLDDGIICEAKITEIRDDTVKVNCLNVLAEPHDAKFSVILAQGLAKGDKMDFVVQKSVELGVDGIIPLALEHSVVQLDEQRADKKKERWQKIAISAAKQAKRDKVPFVTNIKNLNDVLKDKYDLVLMAYEGETKISLKSVLQNNVAKSILLIVGPEGGFSNNEVELAVNAGAKTVSLGRRILRSETAGIVALSCIFYEKDSI